MLLSELSTTWLFIIFIVSSATIWIAGVKISLATDTMSNYFKFGEAIGGVIFLAIVTNLPEIAITTMAAFHGHMEIAVSNILGGIAMQTVVLVLIDRFGVGKLAPLSFKASSVGLLVEGIVLIFILTLVIMGRQIKTDFTFLHGSIIEWLILSTWLLGIYLIYKNPSIKKSKANEYLPVTSPTPSTIIHQKEITIEKTQAYKSVFIFSVCAIFTLVAGFLLEVSSEELAGRFHMSSIVFGATILALVTSLPEISTGIASAKLKDYQLAVSDILGGNAFLPVLLLVGSIISGQSIMSNIGPFDMYITALGILLTGIYMIGLILKSKKQFFHMGYDSIALLIVYLLGIIGLTFVS